MLSEVLSGDGRGRADGIDADHEDDVRVTDGHRSAFNAQQSPHLLAQHSEGLVGTARLAPLDSLTHASEQALGGGNTNVSRNEQLFQLVPKALRKRGAAEEALDAL